MKTPAIPVNEDTRLQALQQLDILDTPPEERFDRYTRLLKKLLDVPIALVSLVDADRQWFKSRQGLGATETTRDISFCGHAILENRLLIVPDARLDVRFHDNPLVMDDPFIRFYGGCPLPGPEGHLIGTLCAIDRRPRELSEDELETLKDVGAMVSGELLSHHLVTTDVLTGLTNRRGLEMLGGQVLSMSKRNGRPAVLAMIDMDGFKSINDNFGHEAGDRALVTFAQWMLATFRDSDVVCRLSGDEFCVLLTNTSEAEAEIALRRLEHCVAERNNSGNEGRALQFSWGIQVYQPHEHTSIKELLSGADSRMYEHKKGKQAASRR